MTKSFYISKEELKLKNDLEHATKYYDEPFFWNSPNAPTQYDQKIELIVKSHKQMICYGNFSMGVDI